jgi:hypothetical protein
LPGMRDNHATMGEQSATRLKGDDYQHLYSWFELLQLLIPESPFEYGYVEHPEAGAADDITLHPRIRRDRAKYMQVKFHVDQRTQYSSAALVKRSQDDARSLLHKLFDAWNHLRQSGEENIEIWLVSNWASGEDLGKFIHDTYVLTEDFFSSGPRSDAGKVRELWTKELGITEESLHSFCRALRLRLGFSGMNELTEKLDDRMARFGLRTGIDPRAIVLDIVRGWIKDGGKSKRIDREVLRKVIEERGLRAVAVEEPKVSLWIHAWAKRAYDVAPTVELDWTAYFNIDSRTVADQQTWDTILLPELKQARQKLAAMPGGTYVDFRGKLPLTASLAVGRVFSETFGVQFRIEQPSGGEVLIWRSDVGPSNYQLTIRQTNLESAASAGLVSLSITGDAEPDVRQLINESPGTFRTFLNVLPAAGAGSAAVKAPSDAIAIASQAKEEIRLFRNQNGLQSIHLVLYCPAALALFLGQRLNALGSIFTYERSLSGKYQPSVCLQTG